MNRFCFFLLLVAGSSVGSTGKASDQQTGSEAEMPTTQIVPIKREEGFFTHYIGSFDDGRQFAGFLFAMKSDDQRTAAVLHVFDSSGKHVESDAFEIDDRVELESWLENRLADFGEPQFGDIRVQPFRANLLGQDFSLAAGDDDTVEYYPLGLVFGPPWTGEILGVKLMPREE